ncbi:Gfo/Idh/MocA family protein [Marinihelvus fidelis]|uniref:Gfo/Idh/MocA family protein n=1 Tax=Marinihelvus fidelis TaxID=2613842 RepID=UPI001CD2D497|nr:Gfo/Idh/MocA family oxidoreductase [Marinihelvus fidelis]
MTSAASYARILGANERINLGFVGLRSRGEALVKSTLSVGGSGVGIPAICDVDSRVLDTAGASILAATGQAPAADADFRRMAGNPDIDAVVIATPDHTHAPFAIMAMQAGKHVYVEKPCSYNARECELLVEAQQRTGRVVQMGNQQRSAPTTIAAIGAIHNGAIGRPYMGKAWYSNKRGSIGTGQAVPVPDWLDWDLWQGPAPRRSYRDNYVHYNWHWFRHWGTGEINNNALHELDICRWALGVGLPDRVTSSGGRFHFQDDWEFYDTQVASYDYAGDCSITWEGRSCNDLKFFGRGRGATIHGTEGSMLIDRNGYIRYDLAGNEVERVDEGATSATTDVVGEGPLVDFHFRNYFDVIRGNGVLHSPIDEGAVSTLMCHLGNIAQDVGRTLEIDTTTGRILGDEQAMAAWSREYQDGWSPEA